MHIGKPIKKTLASTSRPCFSLSTKQPHEVGNFNIASIFLMRFVIMDRNEKLSNTHNESIYIVSACEWQPGSSLLSVVSSTSNCVINIYDDKVSLLHACKGRGPHLPSSPSGNLKVVKGDLKPNPWSEGFGIKIYGVRWDPSISMIIMPSYM